jgi:C4-dicarboxylate transporter DctM subunit
VGMAISKLSLGAISKAIWPLIIIMFGVLALVTYVPAVSLWLPTLLYR